MDDSMKPETLQNAINILKEMKRLQINEAKEKLHENTGKTTARNDSSSPDRGLLGSLRKRVGGR